MQDCATGRCGAPRVDAGAVVLFGEAGLGELEFQFAQDFYCGEDGAGLGADSGGHFEQDAVNFGQLFFEQADEFVVLLDGFEGLDENGLAAGAGAVNDAVDAALLLDFDGDDEAFAADGDEFVLQGAAFGETAEVAAKRFWIVRRCFSISRRMRASSGEALSSSVPSGRILLGK